MWFCVVHEPKSGKHETDWRTYWSPGSRCRSRCRRSLACWSSRGAPWSAAESACQAWWCPLPLLGCSPGWLDPASPLQGNIWEHHAPGVLIYCSIKFQVRQIRSWKLLITIYQSTSAWRNLSSSSSLVGSFAWKACFRYSKDPRFSPVVLYELPDPYTFCTWCVVFTIYLVWARNHLQYHNHHIRLW